MLDRDRQSLSFLLSSPSKVLLLSPATTLTFPVNHTVYYTGSIELKHQKRLIKDLL
jgi:hypothetical protein